MSDPYVEIIEVMKESSKLDSVPLIRIGKVTYLEETQDKLVNIRIKMGDLEIDKKNIYISDYLLKEYKRLIRTDLIKNPKISGLTSTVNDAGQGESSHLHELEQLKIVEVPLYTRDTLQVGDLVSVIPTADRQMYFVMNRVVKL